MKPKLIVIVSSFGNYYGCIYLGYDDNFNMTSATWGPLVIYNSGGTLIDNEYLKISKGAANDLTAILHKDCIKIRNGDITPTEITAGTTENGTYNRIYAFLE